MLLSKKGFPEEDELVLCTVTTIHYHSVFVTLDEFGNKTGMIHISEVAPGRIRNIRDFVKEGKKIVCKVLNINTEKGHIDLSLRRVNEAQKRLKLNQIKQEQLAEKIVENVAKQNKITTEKLYSELYEKINKTHTYLYDTFEEVMRGKTTLEKLGIDKKISKQLTDLIHQRIKAPEIVVRGNFTINCYEEDGVERIKDLLSKVTDETTEIIYSGAGIYKLIVKAEDYKKAEQALQTKSENITTKAKKLNINAQFQKLEA